jgi:hypothetical protein
MDSKTHLCGTDEDVDDFNAQSTGEDELADRGASWLITYLLKPLSSPPRSCCDISFFSFISMGRNDFVHSKRVGLVWYEHASEWRFSEWYLRWLWRVA